MIFYQNIATGDIVNQDEDGGGTTWDDVNRKGLRASLCKPLKVPRSTAEGFANAQGTIQFLGPYAQLGSVNDSLNDATYTLAKCGSAFRKAVPVPTGEMDALGVGHWVAWISSATTVSYFNLASRKSGRWHITANMGSLSQSDRVFLAGDHIYLAITGNPSTTWSAKLPT